MPVETTVPSEFLSDLHYMRDPYTSRLLETIVALGGEVFLLKAEIERLKLALAGKNVLQSSELESAAATLAFKTWLDKEQVSFSKSLLDPISRAAQTKRPGTKV